MDEIDWMLLFLQQDLSTVLYNLQQTRTPFDVKIIFMLLKAYRASFDSCVTITLQGFGRSARSLTVSLMRSYSNWKNGKWLWDRGNVCRVEWHCWERKLLACAGKPKLGCHRVKATNSHTDTEWAVQLHVAVCLVPVSWTAFFPLLHTIFTISS